MIDVVPNFWASYDGLVLIVTSAIAGLCLVAIVILGIKYQRICAMFIVFYNGRGVIGEEVPLCSFIAPTSATVTMTTQTTQSLWYPYEIQNYICVLVILYVLYKHYKFFLNEAIINLNTVST